MHRLPFWWDEAELYVHFACHCKYCPPPVAVKMLRESVGGGPQPGQTNTNGTVVWGLVYYANPSSASCAREHTKGQKVLGRRICRKVRSPGRPFCG